MCRAALLALGFYALGGAVVARSPLGLLNFFVLQWFGVRLVNVRQRVLFGDGPACFKHVRWSLSRWIWPLTGWWSDYRWIKDPGPGRRW